SQEATQRRVGEICCKRERVDQRRESASVKSCRSDRCRFTRAAKAIEWARGGRQDAQNDKRRGLRDQDVGVGPRPPKALAARGDVYSHAHRDLWNYWCTD